MNYPRHKVRRVRQLVQLAFLLFTVFIGVRFHQFVAHFEYPGVYPAVERPASVDAFLPISGLMALKYFAISGMVEPAHPAAMFIFLAAMLVSLSLKKGFCGWICPVGTVSEFAWKIPARLFGRNLRMNAWADLILMGIKYVLLIVILMLIVVAMVPNMMVLYFITDYHKAVDVRMLKLFTDMSQGTAIVLGGLVLLSFLYKGVWCRYLCPYGALLGLLSFMSPLKVRRDKDKCISCGACTMHCPSQIDVKEEETVVSPECIGCLTCVARCPKEGALDMTYKSGREINALDPMKYPVLLLAVFYLVIGLAMVTGKWQTKISYKEYQRIIPAIGAEDGSTRSRARDVEM